MTSPRLGDIDLSKNYVLKTATGGHDGHGQKVIRSEEDLEEAYALADSADCAFWKNLLTLTLKFAIVSGMASDVTVFPVQKISIKISKQLCLLAFDSSS